MAINIKELFVTDLNPNSGAWWSKDKVDKINYNFYLLSNGGMPGPQGTIGVDGGFGPVGAQGDTGYKGPQGYQGYQGMGSLNDWVLFPEADGLPGYLYPRKNPINDIQSAPVALRIGYLSTDSEYAPTGADPQQPVQIVKVKDNDWVNLRVEDNSDLYGYNFKFLSEVSNPNPRFEISPGISGNSFYIINTAQTIVFKTFITNSTPVEFTDSITITDNQITVNTSGLPGPGVGPTFNLSNAPLKFTKSENQFRFTPEAAANKVLVSTDASGNVEWKDVKDVFGTFPIGSIVSIRANEFNTNHFWLNDSVNVTSGSPLNNIYGRGKVGTDFEGWYLCNGETWETTQGFNRYLTPNLNNFSYTIGANGDAQNPITAPESDPVLIGGYDMGISAVPSIDGIYNIEYTTPFEDNDTSPGSSTISMSTPGSYSVSRMIHIVYLEDPNLKWSKTGNAVPPAPVYPTILLGYNASSAVVCSIPATTPYSWTGNNDWNTFQVENFGQVPEAQYVLFNHGTETKAPSGWYVNVDGYPIRWNGIDGDFTLRGDRCGSQPPVNTTPNLTYSLLVDDLNGPAGSQQGGELLYLNFGTGTFLNATSLTWSDNQTEYQPGEPAPTGWYRDVSTGVRRYWDNDTISFKGDSFTQDYVNRVYRNFGSGGINNNLLPYPGYNNGNGGTGTICEELQSLHLTYVAGNRTLLTPTISQTKNVYNYQNNQGLYAANTQDGAANGTGLYVTLALQSGIWPVPMTDVNGVLVHTPPLKLVHTQNGQASTSPYSKVYMEDNIGTSINSHGDHGTINLNNGKISSFASCPVPLSPDSNQNNNLG